GPPPAEKGDMSFSTRKTTLLVVDDDLVSRMALGGLLKRVPGINIVEAGDGLDAWKLLEQGVRPALICSDIQMPGMGGLELLEKARSHPVFSQVPVILISGDSKRETVHAALSQRPAGYIVKPFDGEETRMTVKRILRGAADAQAEKPEDTVRRLNQDFLGLKNMLEVLMDDVAREIAQLDGEAAATDRATRIGRLRTGCLILGLWRAAKVLAAPAGEDPGHAMLRAVLAETKILAGEQRDRHAAEAILQAQEATI
ncbi:MAG: response regulator, partial [Burkholderiaceae bacterium]